MNTFHAGLMCTLLLVGTIAGLFGCMSAVRCHRRLAFAICLAIALLDFVPLAVLLSRLPTDETFSSIFWAAALFLGVFCSGICFVIQSVEQQFTTASHASLIFTLEPVFSAVFAYFLLSERLTVRGYLGAALMLVSLLIMELDVPALLKKDEKAP